MFLNHFKLKYLVKGDSTDVLEMKWQLTGCSLLLHLITLIERLTRWLKVPHNKQ